MSSYKIKDFPWYTILFAAYPTVTLLAHNLGEVESSAAYRAIWMSCLAAMAFVLIFYTLFRDWSIAGVLTILSLFGFFFYGHFFSYIRGLEINGVIIGRHTYFMVFWLGLLLLLAQGIQKSPKVTAVLPSLLATMTVVLLALPIIQIARYQYQVWQNSRLVPAPKITIPRQTLEFHPDIYFIILDMYGRQDVLLDEFSHDDSVFLQELKDMGFYVARCSQSNYHSTAYSLSSTLNANYLNEISMEFTTENTNQTLMWYLIQNSGVEQTLEELGYKTIAFETGYEWTELEDADIFYELHSNGITDFENLLLRNSFVAVFFELGLLDDFRLTSDQRKYDLSIYVLDELENVPSLPGSKFVFVHLTIPHPPFVVGPSGELNIVPIRYEGNEAYYLKDEYKVGYINQIDYLNMRMPQVLQSILDKSAQPPIIILQGDHGPRFIEIEKQLGILNAYYFPEPAPDLYPSISPVNNFRILFNNYFDASLPLLPDRSYFADSDAPYDFKEASNECSPG